MSQVDKATLEELILLTEQVRRRAVPPNVLRYLIRWTDGNEYLTMSAGVLINSLNAYEVEDDGSG